MLAVLVGRCLNDHRCSDEFLVCSHKEEEVLVSKHDPFAFCATVSILDIKMLNDYQCSNTVLIAIIIRS